MLVTGTNPLTFLQLSEFLHFFEHRREVYVTEIEHLFADVEESRVLDDMFSRDDVLTIVRQLLAATTVSRRGLSTWGG